MQKLVHYFFEQRIELSMPVQSLNIDLSNAAICKRAFSSAFIKKELPSSFSLKNRRREGGGEGKREGGRRDTHTSSYRKLSYAGPSQCELRQEYSFLLFSKLGLYCFAGFYIP